MQHTSIHNVICVADKKVSQNESLWFKNCLNKHSETFLNFIDKSSNYLSQKKEDVESTDLKDVGGSMLLGSGIEEPLYDIPSGK